MCCCNQERGLAAQSLLAETQTRLKQAELDRSAFEARFGLVLVPQWLNG